MPVTAEFIALLLIGLDKIDTVERNQVIISGKEITIAPNYKDELNRYITGKSL